LFAANPATVGGGIGDALIGAKDQLKHCEWPKTMEGSVAIGWADGSNAGECVSCERLRRQCPNLAPEVPYSSFSPALRRPSNTIDTGFVRSTNLIVRLGVNFSAAANAVFASSVLPASA